MRQSCLVWRRSTVPENGSRRTFVIFNPASDRGRGAARIAPFVSMLSAALGHVEHGVSQCPGDEARLADQALADGAGLIVAVGGDGTWSHVANRLVASGRKDVTFGILPAGTGNDFAKSLGVYHADPEGAVAAIAGGREVAVDVGRVTATLGDRNPDVRHFLLVSGFGLDTAVLDSVRKARFFRGKVVYQVAALQTIFTYGGIALEYSHDSGQPHQLDCGMLSVCNGSSVGGSFLIAPSASIEDGQLDVCAIRNMGWLDRLRLFGLMSKGTHGDSEMVRLFRVKRIEVTLETPQPLQVDGELQDRPADRAVFEVVPGALRMMAPAR